MPDSAWDGGGQSRPSRRWPRQVGTFLFVATALIMFLSVVAMSPLALAILADRTSEWNTLSDVGQAYGGVSALLSALALCGVAISLVHQWRQTKISQVITARQRQFELVELALTTPSLIYTQVRDVEDPDLPMTQYANLWVSHWKLLWDMKMVRERQVAHLAFELFLNDVAYKWWSTVGTHWNVDGSRRSRRFVAVVMASHDRVTELSAARSRPKVPA